MPELIQIIPKHDGRKKIRVRNMQHEKTGGSQAQFILVQGMAMAYNMVPWMEGISKASAGTSIISY